MKRDLLITRLVAMSIALHLGTPRSVAVVQEALKELIDELSVRKPRKKRRSARGTT